MDSVNSGSLLSSTAEEDVYESRAAGVVFGRPTSNAPPSFFDLPTSSSVAIPDFQQLARWAETVNRGGATAAVRKNPRKRARTSKKAPTTVLTTDTANFRSMVQEFTGIPPSYYPFNDSSLPLPPLPPRHHRRPVFQYTTPFLPNSSNPSSTSNSNPNFLFHGSYSDRKTGVRTEAEEAFQGTVNGKHGNGNGNHMAAFGFHGGKVPEKTEKESEKGLYNHGY